MLEIRNLTTGYGDMKVLEGVSLTVGDGEAVALVGSNGAGKTTLLRAISGIIPVWSGSIAYDGQEIAKMPPHLRPGLGIAHIPQGRGILSQLSVRDNLMLGGYLPAARPKRAEMLEKVYGLFPILKTKAKNPGGSLSGGQRQMLAIGRALMGRPKLLILDEPSLGLAPIMVASAFQIIKDVLSQGVSLLLIEQNLVEALAVTSRAYVLETGKIVTEGLSDDLASDDHVRVAYLGI